jgi:hypothetical protein
MSRANPRPRSGELSKVVMVGVIDRLQIAGSFANGVPAKFDGLVSP